MALAEAAQAVAGGQSAQNTQNTQSALGVQGGQSGVQVWAFDPTHTMIEFSGKHMMFTTVRGRFAEFRGEIALDEANPANSSVEVEINTASIDSQVEMRDNHLRSADFLDVENHPALTFKSRRVELPAGASVTPGLRFKVVGDLTIRGTTREVALDAEYNGKGIGPWGNEVIAFTAATKINRKDWGLNWNVALEAGGLLVGEEIKIELEVQAKPKQAEAA